jgi:hypothetical protein
MIINCYKKYFGILECDKSRSNIFDVTYDIFPSLKLFGKLKVH